ncbi:MAG: dTDP-4-dehydrorhamnose 3,5-epimerase family protein [Saprospiraceae bacterium]
MEIEESKIIAGLRIIKPVSFYDFRGEYLETFSARKYQFQDLSGEDIVFVEDDISVSKQNVLRGLHGDSATWKLIQCLHGEILVAVVDMRKESPGYLQRETYSVSEKNRFQILVPSGCANGHLCISEKCIFSYKQSQYYSGAGNQFTVRWDDPKLNIPWPVRNPLLSERDSNAIFIE